MVEKTLLAREGVMDRMRIGGGDRVFDAPPGTWIKHVLRERYAASISTEQGCVVYTLSDSYGTREIAT